MPIGTMPKEFLEDAFAAGHNGWCEELSRTLPARRFELAWLWQLNGFLTRPGVSTHTHVSRPENDTDYTGCTHSAQTLLYSLHQKNLATVAGRKQKQKPGVF
jgi:hypothetical protein